MDLVSDTEGRTSPPNGLRPSCIGGSLLLIFKRAWRATDSTLIRESETLARLYLTIYEIGNDALPVEDPQFDLEDPR